MRWPRRLWLTLHEPRVITAMMVGTYILVAASMVMILTSPPSTPIDLVAGCAVTVTGAAIGVPAAWRGWWGIEAPATGLVILGLAVVAIEDAVRVLSGSMWMAWPLLILAAAILLLGQRIVHIWGHTWEPGREPPTELRRAEAALQVARVTEADAVARAVERIEAEGADRCPQ